MKAWILVALLASSNATAQVFECPPYYPLQDTTLPANPADPKAIVQIEKRHLSFARIYAGKLYGEEIFTPPSTQKVKGGWNAVYSVDHEQDNWLICNYGKENWDGGALARWEKLEVKGKECVLQVRQTALRYGGTRWTAAANCK